MARLPVQGGDTDQWGAILNGFLQVEHNADGTLKIRTDGTLSGFYAKPSGGIPATDLASSVQTSLGNANGAIQSSIVTAKGDLVAASASATLARLGVGSNGQVLTADSTQSTGLKLDDAGRRPVHGRQNIRRGWRRHNRRHECHPICLDGTENCLGSGTLYFSKGTYLTTGLVFQSGSNFTLLGERGATLWIEPDTTGAPNQVTHNLITIADCTDFSVSGLIIDGRRDTVAPMNILAANALGGQATIQIGNGLGAKYVVGQRLNVLGGLTANGGADVNKEDHGVIIQSISPGAGSANDSITFTANLANSYTAQASSAVSDAYGPYAANGAYITPWQTGETYTVAGRSLSEEDQQNGLHMINCRRFQVIGNTVRNVWESGLRMGTHLLDGSSQNDGCSYGTVADNVIYHCYDQGVGVWASHDVTVSGNVISSAGWAGVSLTMGYDCTVGGNVIDDNVQRIPGDTNSGSGVAIEGGYRNTVTANLLRSNDGPTIYLTAAGTLPYGSPGQVATTVASGSNSAALPAGTINVGSTAGFAGSGTFTVLSSAGTQNIVYTGTTGTSFTGCTGGLGTLFTNQKVVQYPLFINNGAVLPPGSTTITVSDGTKFQTNGHYSITDNAKTERIMVTAIAGNVITLATATVFLHADKTQIGQAVPEANVIANNSVLSGTDAGIQLISAVRTSVTGNTIANAGYIGIDGVAWASGGLQAPFGTLVQGNMVTAPGSAGSGALYQAIAFQQTGDLTVSNNYCNGAPSVQGYFYALGINTCFDSVISANTVSDAYAVGIRIDTLADWPCKRIVVSHNIVHGTFGEGIILFGGDSLLVEGNTITNCAANNGPGGYGGALDVRGVKNSQISGNVVVNNGHGGIGLDTASLNGANVTSSGNIISGNISRDDGSNYDAYNGAATQQGNGIAELSAGQGPNTYVNNLVSGCGTNWNIQSTGNTLRGNQNFNPVGLFGAQPGVPTSGTPYTNVLNADATVYVAGGTVTAVSVGGHATGMVAGSFRVLAGQTITLAYSAAPTWEWFGD